MAKRFAIENDTASYLVADGMNASLDLNKAFSGWSSFSENVKAALIFSLKTALRNATAGKMDTDAAKKEAFDSVKKRCAALESGVWAARREGSGGESRESVLARALAIIMETEVSAAIAFIDDLVEKTLEENGIDAGAEDSTLSEEEKTKKAKLIRATKKAISDDPAVALKMATIKREDLIAKEAELAKAAEGKTSKFAK